ncbi:MAG: metalloregulator ArsR/SmtB family transcription factor [Actinomycetota bacterium]
MTATTTEAEDQLTATFSALAHPVRRSILARLADGEASVGELAAPFEMTMPAISRHLRVLEGAGLIARGRRAQYRPCRLNAEPLRVVADWTEQYRQAWEERFDRLDEHVRTLQLDPDTEPDSQHDPDTEHGGS